MAENSTDPVKEFILQVLDAVVGDAGDYFIFAALGLCALAAFRRMFKVSAGFFILALGTVVIRVLIGGLF